MKDAADLFKKFTTFVNNKEYYKQQSLTHAKEVRSTYSIEQHVLSLSNLYNTLNAQRSTFNVKCLPDER